MRRTPFRARAGIGALCAAVLCLLPGAAACTRGERSPQRLRVLASGDLGDLRPVLADLRRDTGVEMIMDYRAGVETAALPDDRSYDLAWPSSGGYLQLRQRGRSVPGSAVPGSAAPGSAAPGAGRSGPVVVSRPVMLSPVVVGIRPQAAAALRAATRGAALTWADLADAAAAGTLRLAMPDPASSGSGLVALVGVATAAAGTGAALRPEDVTCDRLRGFFTGQAVTAPTAAELTDRFVARQDEVDALVAEESALLALNDSGRLRQPLDLVYPADGIVQADHPLVLLDPAKRAAYDRALAWLTGPTGQRRIARHTRYRPVDPAVGRDARLRGDPGGALYFPDRAEVVDALLARYADPRSRTPDRVVFVLDYSGSMRGDRIAALRATFAGLSGADRSRSGKFFRFSRGETFTVVRFGGRILDERDFTVDDQRDLDALGAFLAADDFDGTTAVWSALEHAYRAVAGAGTQRAVSIVLMTDGENNAGTGLDEFLDRYARDPAARAVPTFTIRYGEADPAALDRVARATGGRMVDAGAVPLLDAFKEIRGCH